MNYLDTYNIWKSKHLEDPDLIAEMVDIEGNDHEIKERFVKMLEFGTAGLRGILGVGTNRMNIYTVALATQRSEERRVGKECRSRWSPYH